MLIKILYTTHFYEKIYYEISNQNLQASIIFSLKFDCWLYASSYNLKSMN